VTDDQISPVTEYYPYAAEHYVINDLWVHAPRGLFNDDACKATPSVPCLKAFALSAVPTTYSFNLKITAEGDAIHESPQIQVLIACGPDSTTISKSVIKTYWNHTILINAYTGPFVQIDEFYSTNKDCPLVYTLSADEAGQLPPDTHLEPSLVIGGGYITIALKQEYW
jgi:hypothetical protein